MCLVFEVVWRNLGILVCSFWSTSKESRGFFLFWYCCSVKESFFVFHVVSKNLRDTLCLVFRVVKRNFGHHFFFLFFFEIGWAHSSNFLRDFKQSLEPLLSCFSSNLKVSRRLLVSSFWSNLKESRGSLVSGFWSDLKESLRPLLLWFWTSLKVSRVPFCFDFEVVWKNFGDTCV